MSSLNKNYSLLILTSMLLLLQSCSVKHKIVSDINHNQKTPYFTGLVVVNPKTGQTLISHNPHHYFTPASTVKLFTLYTALHYLNDSIATFDYFENDTTLVIKPLADPSFLHDSLPNNTLHWLKSKKKKIYLVQDTFEDTPYGEGWQWDDYPYYYMPEKSLLPIYANLITVKEGKTIPSYFQNQISTTLLSDCYRDFDANRFYYNENDNLKSRKIPFRTDLALSAKLLADTLKTSVTLTNDFQERKFKKHISTPVFPLYKRLMNESENFMAEQLFLVISKNKTQSYKVQNTIHLALDSLFQNLPDKPRWVDASGLSRYNLFTPQSMVDVLHKMLEEQGLEKIKKLLPRNGISGSLQKWYPFNQPYLYAKTGSVSNNHSLCGYLITKKGTLLIFSYMNNNFMISSQQVRQKMNQHLQMIYEKY